MRAVVLPAKPLGIAKSRFRPFLADRDRELLARTMLGDVLRAAVGSREAGLVVVVSADGEVGELAREAGARFVTEGDLRGAAAAADIGTRRAIEEGADAVAVLLTDLPLASAGEIDALLRDGAAVRLVRSHDGAGTNAVLRRPAGVIPAPFGGGSYARAIESARVAGVATETDDLPGLALDVDVPEDLDRVLRVGEGVDSATVRLVRDEWVPAGIWPPRVAEPSATR